MIYVGMDVHVRNSYLIATDGAGQVLARGRCSNHSDALAGFLDRLPREPMRVCLESTTNSRAVHRFLQSYGQETGVEVRPDVLDARRLRIIAESVCKTDRVDTAVLAALARSNLQLPCCYIPDDEVFALREHLRSRGDLVRIRTMLKNRVHALLHRRGVAVPVGGLFTRSGRAYLDQLDLDDAGREILDRLLAAIEALEQAIGESTVSLKDVMRRDRWSKPAALLQTMPGIGVITALTILAELGDRSRFRSRSAVANYAGLVPVVRDSNEKSFRGHLTHRGSKHLRAVLVEAAWMAKSRVPKYSELFRRVKYKKNAPTAICAVARELLEDAFTMLRKDEAFRYVPTPVQTSERDGHRPGDGVSSVAG